MAVARDATDVVSQKCAEANLEELALLLNELLREFEQTNDTQRRKEIATEISELTHTLRNRSAQKQ